MNLTRLSLFYPAMYLVSGGVMFMAAPRLALKLFFATGDYGDVFPRFAGVLILGLGLLVVQVIRLRLDSMYRTLLWVRAFFCAGWIGLYFQTHDPFFLVMLGMVGFGFVLTGLAVLKERSAPTAP